MLKPCDMLSKQFTMIVFAIVALVSAIVCASMSIETKNNSMPESLDEATSTMATAGALTSSPSSKTPLLYDVDNTQSDSVPRIGDDDSGVKKL